MGALIRKPQIVANCQLYQLQFTAPCQEFRIVQRLHKTFLSGVQQNGQVNVANDGKCYILFRVHESSTLPELRLKISEFPMFLARRRMCFYGLLGSSFSLLPAWRANTTERRTVDRRNEKKKVEREWTEGNGKGREGWREGWKERKMMQPGTRAKMCPTTYLVQQNDTSQAERFTLCMYMYIYMVLAWSYF